MCIASEQDALGAGEAPRAFGLADGGKGNKTKLNKAKQNKVTLCERDDGMVLSFCFFFGVLYPIESVSCLCGSDRSLSEQPDDRASERANACAVLDWIGSSVLGICVQPLRAAL